METRTCFQYRIFNCITFMMVFAYSSVSIVQLTIAKIEKSGFTPIRCSGCSLHSTAVGLSTNHGRQRRYSLSSYSSGGIQHLDNALLKSYEKLLESEYVRDAVVSPQHTNISPRDTSLRSFNSTTKYRNVYLQNKRNVNLMARYQPFTSNGAIYSHSMSPQNSAQISQSIPVQSSMPVMDVDTNEINLKQLQTDPESAVGDSSSLDLINPQLVETDYQDLTYTQLNYQPQPDSYTSSIDEYGYPYSGYQQPLPDITTPPVPVANPTDYVGQPPPQTATQVVAPLPPPTVGAPSPAIGHYYLGKKFWVVPLFFSIYYIVYVICLMLRAMKIHKAYYPENLHNAILNGSTSVGRQIHLISDDVWTALETFSL